MALRAKGVAGQEGKAIAFIFSARTIADDCQLEVESSVEYGVCAKVVVLVGTVQACTVPYISAWFWMVQLLNNPYRIIFTFSVRETDLFRTALGSG